MDDKIKLHLSNGNVFVWNAKDARILRDEFRIAGTLIGCLPRAPRQNVHLGLPLQLMPEEAKLLIDRDLVTLVDDTGVVKTPSPCKVEAFKRIRTENYEAQIELFREDRKKEMTRMMPKIIEGKKQKLAERKKQKGEQVDESKIEREVLEECNVDKITIPAISEDNSIVQLFTESPWSTEPHQVQESWLFPSSPRECLRYRVFQDLWQKGYFLTTGNKFGGDFLVYPGDPSRYHSFYIAICKLYQEKMMAFDIISLGRLGSNVKKSVLLCSMDDKENIVYTSLQWTGIS